jgi:hypothetical protein
MTLDKNAKLSLMWLISLIIILLGIFGLRIYLQKGYFGNVKIYSTEKLVNLVGDKEYTDCTLIFQGQDVAYDKGNDVYYISYTTEGDEFKGNFSVQGMEATLYFEDDGMNDYEEIMYEGHISHIWAISEQSYSILNVIITGAPVLNINSDEILSTDYQSGYISLFNSTDNTVSDAMVKYNANSETYSIKLTKGNSRQDRKLDLLNLGEYKSWKLYKVSENDGSLMRALLASDLWNALNNDSNNKRGYKYVEIVENGKYKGLYLLTPKWTKSLLQLSDSETILDEEDIVGVNADFENISQYFIFLQAAYAYKNVTEDYIVVDNQVIPDKITYAFGGFNNKLNYLSWDDDGRMLISYKDLGIDETTWNSKVFNECQDYWVKLRNNYLNENILFKNMEQYKEFIIKSGLGNRCVPDNSFGYFYDKLYQYIVNRINFLDDYFGYTGERLALYVETVESVTSLPTDGFVDISVVNGISDENADNQYAKLYIKDEDSYFFMPSYFDLSSILLSFDEELYKITIDNKKIKSGDGITVDLDKEYSMKVEYDGSEYIYTLTFMQSKNLPSIFISTENDTMDYINDNKSNTEPGSLICIDSNGIIDTKGNLDKIKMRGNTSLSCNKKTYQISFSEDTNFLGMGSARNFILQANAYDGSFMRNKLVYDLAKEMGLRYAIDSEYADVYFNNEYAGNYLVCEKVEVGGNRIDIPVTDEDDIVATVVDEESYRYYNINSTLKSSEKSFFIEANNIIVTSDAWRIDEDSCYFTSTHGTYEIKVPEKSSKEDVLYIRDYMEKVEELISECDTDEEYENLNKYIDIESFAITYLINIITNEVDSNDYSTFYYKLPDSDGGVFYAGPVWDYDRSFGNDERGYMVNVNGYPNGICERLFENEMFRAYVEKKYSSEVSTMLEKCDSTFFEDLTAYLKASVSMNRIRWQDDDRINYMFTEFDDEVSYLSDYYLERIELVGGLMNNEYHMEIFSDSTGRSYSCIIKNGETASDDIIEFVTQRFSQ